MRGLSEQKNAAPWSRIADSLLHNARNGGCDNHGIGPTPPRHLHDTRKQGWIARVEGGSRSQPDRQFAAERHAIGGQHGSARSLHQHGEEQTDGPLAQYYHDIFGLRVQLDHAFQTGVNGFYKAGAIKRYAIRDFLNAAPDNPIHDTNVLRKSAACRLISRCYADFFINRALSVQLVAAVETFETRNMVEDDDAIAGREVADARAR